MCGICGIIGRTTTDITAEVLHAMNNTLAHRGPDGEAVFWEDCIALGHRRLSVIDLSERGRQPLLYRDRYVIVYNGMVYNYLELREELEGHGYTFMSQTDTEVICAAYDHWGVDCLHRFNGMWAFALYDRHTCQLFCARDRFGVKPFYYTVTNRRIIFASEIKALLCDPNVPRIANAPIVYDFLTQGLLDHTPQDTFFEGILRLPAGHYLMLDASLTAQPVRYYNLTFSQELGLPANDEQIAHFRQLFDDAVAIRLRADVAIGSCLSGGLDSSAIVCAVRNVKNMHPNLSQKTFSSVPADKRVDESKYIAAVIDKTGVKNIRVMPDANDLLNSLNALVYHQDEPFNSTGIYASYRVMKAARDENVCVLLDGQGADEILCGYRKSRIYYIRRLVKAGRYFKAARELMFSLSQVRTSLFWRRDIDKINRILGKKGTAPPFHAYLDADFAVQGKGVDYDRSADFQYNDLMVVSLPILLRYADRNAMAFAIEDRLPFLDYRLVEYCASLPLATKLDRGYSKVILRQALDLPDKVRCRKSKMGFGVPEDTWLRQNEQHFRHMFEGQFHSARFVDRQKLLRDWDDIIQGKKDIALWRFISLELWMRTFQVQ